MSVEDLERAVTQLSPGELVQFSAWFAEYKSEMWDDDDVVKSMSLTAAGPSGQSVRGGSFGPR